MDDLLSELWACLENQGADGFLIRGAEIRQRTTVHHHPVMTLALPPPPPLVHYQR